MPPDDKPKLHLTPLQVLCGRHGEILRARWPMGWPEFIAIGLDALNHTENYQKAVMARVEEGVVLEHAMQDLLNKVPICCRLPSEYLLEAYHQIRVKAGPWDHRQCDLCEKWEWGGAYRKVLPTVVSGPNRPTWRHVCLRCVVYGGPRGKGLAPAPGSG